MRFALFLACMAALFAQSPEKDGKEPRFDQFRVATPLAERSASGFTTTPRFDGSEARADQDLRDMAAAGPNFAGHYAVISWTCGMACEGFAVVDVKSGRIYHPGFQVAECRPYDPNDRYLISFRLDSRLLIVKGVREDYSKENGPCGTFYYVVEEVRQRDHKSKSNKNPAFALKQVHSLEP